MSRAAFVLAILASLTLSIAVQASQGIQDPPTPRRVSPGPGDDRYTALLVDVDGRAALSWLRRDPVGQVATLYVAQAPDWDAIPIVSLPYDATIQSALSSSPEGALELTWISSGPDGEAIRRHTLDGEVSLAWERRLPEPRAFTLDGDGRIHYAWADGAALVYEVESQVPPDERAAPAVRLSLDPGTIVDAIVLAVDAQGLAHLAWASRDALGQWGGVHYAPAIAGARPMRVASEGAAPHLAVGPSGIVHLCWQSTHALYYATSATSGNWEETRLVVRDLTADAPVALAVGPQEMAHLAWSQGGYLWHSCSLDWASARRRVAEARDTSGLDLAIDGWGRPHLAWSSGGVRGGTYYLPPVSLSPQFRVTRPSGGDVLWRDTEARAETNLDEGALLRVEFYLESAEAPRDAPDNPLIELGSDHDGSDGWSAPIHVSRLDRGLCYRVMLLATDTEGTLIPAWGDWFRWVGPDESALWLPSRPPTEPEDPSPLTGGPIRGRTRLEALRLHGSWGAEEAMLPVSQDLYAVPVERGDQAVTCKTLESLLSDAHYLGAYPVPRSENEALVRQELGPLDSATLPDGHYVLVAMNTDPSGGQRFGGASRPFETNNSMYPSVVVESPRGGEIIQGDLRVSAMASDPDGEIQRVEFFLEACGIEARPPDGLSWDQTTWRAEVASLIWLGSDTDGADGWSLERAVRDAWDGDCWRVVAVAVDDLGQASEARSDAGFTIVGRRRPVMRFAEPASVQALAGNVAVELVVWAGNESLERIELYVEDVHGRWTALAPLAPPSPTPEADAGPPRWSANWDTRPWLDGDYTLCAVGVQPDGRASVVRSDRLTVRNTSLRCTVVGLDGAMSPAEGALVVSGTVLLMGEPGQGASPLKQMGFYYYADAAGQLHLIGHDATRSDGWSTLWHTAAVLDGAYDLVLVATDSAGLTHRGAQKVVVRNRTPGIAFASLAASEPITGPIRITWQAEHLLGQPMSVTVSYSPDAGVHWLDVATDVPATDSFLWDPTDVDGRGALDSNQGLLRVTASDGVYSAQAVSGPIVVSTVNNAPIISLLAPQRGRTYSGSIPVAWEAWDPDGDPLRINVDYRQGEGPWRVLAEGLANTGSFEWRAGAAPAGDDYQIRVSAVDPGGLVSSDTGQRISLVNNTPPVVRLLWPDSAVHVDKETVILWRAQDEDGDPLLIDLYYSDNAGKTWIPLAEGLANEGYYQWQVSFLPVGVQYRVRVVARDAHFAAWDESEDVFSVGWNARPQAVLLSPAPGDVVAGLWAIRWHASDPEGSPVRVSLMVRASSASPWETLATDLPNDGLYLWDTTSYPDGSYYLQIVVTDGTVSTLSSLGQPITLANGGHSPPRVALRSPLGGERWSGLRAIMWDAWDPDGDVLTATLMVRGDGQARWHLLDTLDARAGYYIWDTRQFGGAGPHRLRILVTDGKHEAHDTTWGVFHLVNRDNYPPHVTMLSPDATGTLRDGRLVTWLAEDADGDPPSLSLALSTDEGVVWRVESAELYNAGEYLLDAPLEPDRTYRLRLAACNGTFCLHTIADARGQRPPADLVPELAIMAPLGGERWSGVQTIRWQAEGLSGEDVRISISFSQDGGRSWEALAQDLENTGAYEWDTRPAANGPCRLRLLASGDRAGKLAISGSFVLGNPGRHAPWISLVCPREGDVWSGSREIQWQAYDADGDNLAVSLAYCVDGDRNWQPIATNLRGLSSYVWDTTAVPNAERLWLRVVASDGMLQRAAQSTGPFAIRNRAAPTVRLLEPTAGAYWTGTGRISWITAHAEDATRASLEASWDDGESWRVLATNLPARGYYYLDLAPTAEGGHVRIRARVRTGVRRGVDIAPGHVTIYGQTPAQGLPLYLR